MRNLHFIIMTILLCLLTANIFAEEKDANGCKDHPLMPRMPGYYIAGCSEIPASADLDIIKGNVTESVHFEGKSVAVSYMVQPQLKTKPTEAQVRSYIEKTVKKMNGSLFGLTYGQKWPVYSVAKAGKKYWIILLINSGEYFTGAYTCRIIEKK